MARDLFGGSSDDYAVDTYGKPVTNRRVRFYTSAARTTEITDLASDAAGTGSPLTVSTDAHGFWGPVYGPDAVTVMYAGAVDASGNPPTYVVAVYTHSSAAAGVASFNTRTGAVSLSKADVTGTALAAADVGADVTGAAASAQTAAQTYADTAVASRAKPRGAWAPTTAYAVNDVVTSGGAPYRCLVAHTSGASFSGAGTNWEAWSSAASLPSQTGNNGKFLTTDGSNPSWATVVSGTVPVTSANSTTAYTITAPTHGESRLKLTLTGNCVITLTGGTAAEVCAVQVQLVQDATGSRTVTWPGSLDWGVAGAPVLDVTAGKFTRVYLTTDDGGLSWQGAIIGGGYSAPVAPSAPTSLAATGSTGQVALTWTQGAANGSTVTQNKIYRSTSTGTETLLATVSAATSYTDASVTNLTTYFYKVTAVNALGEGPLSNEASATPGVTTIAADNFNRADAIATNSTNGLIGQTTPTGAKTWLGHGGLWSVSSNVAVCSASSGVATIDSGVADCTVQADYNTGTGNSGGFFARWVDTNNWIAVISDPTGWYLQKKVAGSQSNIVHAGTPVASTTYTVSIVLSGNSVTVKINGVTTVSGTITDTALQSGTQHGIQSGGASNFWDNFLVTVP